MFTHLSVTNDSLVDPITEHSITMRHHSSGNILPSLRSFYGTLCTLLLAHLPLIICLCLSLLAKDMASCVTKTIIYATFYILWLLQFLEYAQDTYLE